MGTRGFVRVTANVFLPQMPPVL